MYWRSRSPELESTALTGPVRQVDTAPKNPVTIEVIKREKMEIPGGKEVDCLVLHPVIDTKGMFSKRSDTRIWLTDDARRLPVQIRSKFPFGTITLRLKEVDAVLK